MKIAPPRSVLVAWRLLILLAACLFVLAPSGVASAAAPLPAERAPVAEPQLAEDAEGRPGSATADERGTASATHDGQSWEPKVRVAPEARGLGGDSGRGDGVAPLSARGGAQCPATSDNAARASTSNSTWGLRRLWRLGRISRGPPLSRLSA